MENKIYILYKDFTNDKYNVCCDNYQTSNVITASHSKKKLMDIARQKIQKDIHYLNAKDGLEIKESEDEIVLTYKNIQYQYFIDSVDFV